MSQQTQPAEPNPKNRSNGCLWYLMLFVTSVSLIILLVVAAGISALGASLVSRYLPSALWASSVICAIVGSATGLPASIAGASFAFLTLQFDSDGAETKKERGFGSLLAAILFPLFVPELMATGVTVGGIVGAASFIAPGWEALLGAGSVLAAFGVGMLFSAHEDDDELDTDWD